MTLRLASPSTRLIPAVIGALAAVAIPVQGIELPLVVTQMRAQIVSGNAAAEQRPLAAPNHFVGAQLVVVSPDGSARSLSKGFESACDPDVSFDGQRVLFSGRRESGARWRIWEIGLDGGGLRAVSPENLDARQPIHVSTLFTLDSPKPWYTMVFVGWDAALNEAGRPGVFSLYNLKLDGDELRRLTFNPNANVDPFQMWDGRILYAAERWPKQPGAVGSRVEIHAVHIEGADMELYGGERGRRIQRTPCATDNALIVFVESDAPSADGSGQLACVEERRPHVTYRELTGDPAFVYREPAPLSGGRILVSRRPATTPGTWGMGVVSTTSGAWEPVFDTTDHHEVQAVVVAPRKSPDGHSTVVETRFDTGVFYGLNCYDADQRMAPHIRTSKIQRIRFIEGVPAAVASSKDMASPDHLSVHRRLVGEAPVEPDGSFNVEVPADIPLLLQTLDDRGMALATCGWIWVKPREKRGCIGCHEDPERIPENDYVLALRRPSNRLVLPAGQRRTVTFRDDVAPILQTHCANANCHGGEKSDLHLPLSAASPAEADFRSAYDRLLATAQPDQARESAGPPAGKYVNAGQARTSPLAWHLAGTNTARPWDPAATTTGPRDIPLMPPPDKGRPLSPEQLHTFIQWMDLGALYVSPIPRGQPNSVTKP